RWYAGRGSRDGGRCGEGRRPCVPTVDGRARQSLQERSGRTHGRRIAAGPRHVPVVRSADLSRVGADRGVDDAEHSVDGETELKMKATPFTIAFVSIANIVW